MMHINEIISIFLYGKRYPGVFLKAFYNSLTAKNRFVIKCMLLQHTILEEEKSSLNYVIAQR